MMAATRWCWALVVAVLLVATARGEASDAKIAKARIEDVEVKYIPGRSPKIMFFTAEDVKVETVDLAPLQRDEAEKLLTDRGFLRLAIQFKQLVYLSHASLRSSGPRKAKIDSKQKGI
ncbi:uncharacterized protein MONBRDRAFT_31994 [Monosiga brevicollis MX1]|uniref:Selenoprotein F/M domain-containing protein n=1 Tax=Monosiga brevicollis TaxID=81824 RepID=A9UWR0_MONBE|nr:uncharacterized protein MONBRDRAFT_31994 [Monosiga brevicollis MX1]EDQ90087.1 predicted protein [Monosiga brevicollis MX1]|eukprot:XP_001744854.1 hypothetical protein [Monosiga brevicollis MX1]